MMPLTCSRANGGWCKHFAEVDTLTTGIRPPSPDRSNFYDTTEITRTPYSDISDFVGPTTATTVVEVLAPEKGKKVILDVIDIATICSQAIIIPNKGTHCLLAELNQCWLQPYGPPKNIESDREPGLATIEAKRWLALRREAHEGMGVSPTPKW